MMKDIEKIRRLNDLCRRNSFRHTILLTPWVKEQSEVDKRAILQKVAEYNAFTPSNDPYHEHDFGVFQYNNQKLFWRIDYYNSQMQLGTDDPADESKTNRVLSIMHCNEF